MELQRELYLPRRALEGHDRTGRTDRTRARRPDVRVRVVELWSIEGVEELRAKLQVARLVRAQLKVLEHGQVEQRRAWTFQQVARRVAERVLRRRGEAGGIEITKQRSLRTFEHGI